MGCVEAATCSVPPEELDTLGALGTSTPPTGVAPAGGRRSHPKRPRRHHFLRYCGATAYRVRVARVDDGFVELHSTYVRWVCTRMGGSGGERPPVLRSPSLLIFDGAGRCHSRAGDPLLSSTVASNGLPDIFRGDFHAEDGQTHQLFSHRWSWRRDHVHLVCWRRRSMERWRDCSRGRNRFLCCCFVRLSNAALTQLRGPNDAPWRLCLQTYLITILQNIETLSPGWSV